MDTKAFFNMSYGLYIVSTTLGGKNYGCVINTMAQVTSKPAQISIAVNKDNATTKAILEIKVFSGVILSENIPMDVISTFGFRSSVEIDKFEGLKYEKDENAVPYLTENISSQFSCKVVNTMDVGTHMLIVGEVVDCKVITTETPMTYNYYHKVKKGTTPPKASSYQEEKKSGYTCSICGYVYEGDVLPDDYICPICKQEAKVFVKN